MSVSNQTNKIYGSGNGVTTVFSYPFKIFDTSELYAYLINTATGVVTGPLTYTTDFTATISAVTEGGTITFVVPPPTGTTWFLKRLVPYTQSAVIPSEGTFPGKQFENQLDLITMMVIQANETITRCAQLSATSLLTGVTLPDPVDGYSLAWSGVAGAMQNVPINAAAINTAVAAAAASATAAAASQTAASSSQTAAAASAVSAAASAVTAALYAVPAGGIIMWSGLLSAIPTGWVICNGSNGTPDLRSAMVVSTANATNPGTVSGNAYVGAHTHTTPDHTHTLRVNNAGGGRAVLETATAGELDSSAYVISSGTGTTTSTGTAVFYALAYIMKT